LREIAAKNFALPKTLKKSPSLSGEGDLGDEVLSSVGNLTNLSKAEIRTEVSKENARIN